MSTTPTVRNLTYDANGNVSTTGDGRRYAYDAFNNLTHVYETVESTEVLYARFWYNTLGRRIAAAYNEIADTETGEAVFDNDSIEFFAYDDLWRLRAVYVREPGQSTATCRERYAYDNSGLNGRPTSAALDSPIFGQIDSTGDGTFERSFQIVQGNSGDVLKIIEPGKVDEEVRYSLWGEPRIVTWWADINHDGKVDGDDAIDFFALWDNGDGLADMNGDSGVDGDDVIIFLGWWDEGQGNGLTLADNRFGFRGYGDNNDATVAQVFADEVAPRAAGAAQIAVGALEAVAGAVLATGGGMVSGPVGMAAGGVVLVHSGDLLSTGFHNWWYGDTQDTRVHKLVHDASIAAGMTEDEAQVMEVAVDAQVGVVASLGMPIGNSGPRRGVVEEVPEPVCSSSGSRSVEPKIDVRLAKHEPVGLSKSAVKEIRSLERNIAEHETKLAEYLSDPDKYDNKGFLKGADPERRRRIIEGRAAHLRQEMRAWRDKIESLQRGE